MLLSVISPAKRLAEAKSPTQPALASLEQLSPRFAGEVGTLVRAARKLKAPGLKAAMHISDDLAALNAKRFGDFALTKSGEVLNDVPNAQTALHIFQGDVYLGLNAKTLDVDGQTRAQDCLRILSGLYGLLRPFDLIQPYRLEMGTKIETRRGNTLYEFWGDKITKALNQDAQELGSNAIVNLASHEYWRAVQPKKLGVPVVTCQFKEWKDDKLKIISFNAKRARGLMARFVIDQGVDQIGGIKDFTTERYKLAPDHSTDNTLVFARPFVPAGS